MNYILNEKKEKLIFNNNYMNKAYWVYDYNLDKIIFVSLDWHECNNKLQDWATLWIVELDKIKYIEQKLKDNMSDAYNYLSEYADEYLSEYATEYLDSDTIERIEQSCEDVDLNQELWRAVYDIVLELDATAEYKAWYISWLKEAINLLTKE